MVVEAVSLTDCFPDSNRDSGVDVVENRSCMRVCRGNHPNDGVGGETGVGETMRGVVERLNGGGLVAVMVSLTTTSNEMGKGSEV